jgi:hypothetical protein
MAQRTCEVEDCTKPHRARGLCSTHYNQQHQPVRHRKVTVMCGWCGRPTDKSPDSARGYEHRFCTLTCRDTWRQRNKLPVVFVGVVVRADPRTPARQRAPRVFVCGTCTRCGNGYVAEDYTDTARYCSIGCARRVAKQRRRSRKRAAYIADVSPARIYERDGWRCQLCRKKVRRDKVVPHPMAPVLDHIIPLAAGVEDGGVHAPHNVQCAHFMCNSIKRDRVSDVQLALFG